MHYVVAFHRLFSKRLIFVFLIPTFMIWLVASYLFVLYTSKIYFFGHEIGVTICLLIVTSISVLFAFPFVLLRRNTVKDTTLNGSPSRNTTQIRIVIHSVFLIICLLQCFFPIYPIGNALSQIPLTQMDWIQRHAPIQMAKPISYVAILFFPSSFHQLFVMLNFYGLLSIFHQRRRTIVLENEQK